MKSAYELLEVKHKLILEQLADSKRMVGNMQAQNTLLIKAAANPSTASRQSRSSKHSYIGDSEDSEYEDDEESWYHDDASRRSSSKPRDGPPVKTSTGTTVITAPVKA